MPIEIKELIIRASVRDESGPAGQRAVADKDPVTVALQEERIIRRCTEQVMDILRIKEER